MLDTNTFFNLQEIKGLGKTAQEVIENLTFRFKKLSKKLEVFIPPSVVSEINTFFEEEPEFLKRFLAVVKVKAPERNLTKISGQVFYDFVKETRNRAYRGLKVAEEETRKAAKLFLEEKPKDKIEFEKKVGEIIKTLRDRYRNATRTKILDSSADVDLLLLAKELNATLLSTDEGVLLWAEKLGIKTLPASIFKQWLENLES